VRLSFVIAINFLPLKARLLIALLMVWLHAPGVKAQFPSFTGDARSKGMSGTSVMLASHWSCLSNPAGIAGIRAASFGLYYENHFEVPELGTGSFTVGLPTRSGNFGAGFITIGCAGLRQSQASMSYGRNIGSRVRAGIGVHWLMVSQPAGYADLFAVIPSLGLQVMPFEKMIVGISVFNPAGQELIPAGYLKIPVVFQAGIGYQLGEEVLLCMESQKRSGEKARYSGGFEITLKNAVHFRFGIFHHRISGFSLGVGYTLKQLSIDIAVARHPVLGYSPATGLTYAIK
jgi:hypothetical protein